MQEGRRNGARSCIGSGILMMVGSRQKRKKLHNMHNICNRKYRERVSKQKLGRNQDLTL